MFDRYIGEAAYAVQETQRWLGWLAQMMFAHNTELFLIDQLQPSWLELKTWKWAYIIIHRFVFSLFAGVMAWMVIALNRVQLIDGLSNLVACIALCLVIGILVAIWDGYQLVLRQVRRGQFARGDPRRSWREAAVIGVLAAVLVAVILALFGANTISVANGALWIGAFHVLMTYDSGKSLRNQIATSEALSWSWTSASKGIIPGLAIGGVFALVMAVSFRGLNWRFVSNVVGPWVLVLVLFNGLRGRRLPNITRPNQGIWLSLRNGTYAALLIGSIFGSYFILILAGYEEPFWPAFVMGSLLGLAAGQKYGGGVIEHAILRLLLWKRGSLPLNLIGFLDYADRLILLHKVGGGYIFMHRSLQEHFAQLDVPLPAHR